MANILKPVCPGGVPVDPRGFLPGTVPIHRVGAAPVTHGLRRIIPVYHGRVPVLSRFVTVSPWFYPVFDVPIALKLEFSLSRLSSPAHPGLTNRDKPGRTVANRGRTEAAPWTTGANRGEPACLAGRFKMLNRTGANRDKCQKP